MNNNKTFITIAVVAFITGLIVGYFTWGKEKERKTDVKGILNQAIQGVEAIEKENRDLKVDLERAEKDELAKENQTLKEQLKEAQQNSENMKNEINELRAQVAQTETKLRSEEEFREVSDNLKSRLSEMEKENQDLKLVLEKINSLIRQHATEIPQQP